MSFVLDVLGEDIEIVDLRGEARGDRRATLVATLGDDAGGARGVARNDRPDAELADDAAALPECMNMTFDGLDIVERCAARRHQLMADRQKVFADDEQPGLRQQVMNVGDTAGHRILDRDHAEIGVARRDRGQRILEGGAGQRLGIGIGVGDRDMGIRAGLALECDFHGAGHQVFYQPVDFSLVWWFRSSPHCLGESSSELLNPNHTRIIAGVPLIPKFASKCCEGMRASESGSARMRRAVEISRRIDSPRHILNNHDVDPHSGFQCP